MIHRLTLAERVALGQLRDELYPRHTEEAVALKLLRDALIGAGVLKLGTKNRGPGAKTARPDAR